MPIHFWVREYIQHTHANLHRLNLTTRCNRDSGEDLLIAATLDAEFAPSSSDLRQRAQLSTQPGPRRPRLVGHHLQGPWDRDRVVLHLQAGGPGRPRCLDQGMQIVRYL